MTAKARRPLGGGDLQTLTKMLRDRLDAIDAEMTDALHLLDEIEAVANAITDATDTEARHEPA